MNGDRDEGDEAAARAGEGKEVGRCDLHGPALSSQIRAAGMGSIRLASGSSNRACELDPRGASRRLAACRRWTTGSSFSTAGSRGLLVP